MGFEVKILADSVAYGTRLTTVQATFPRFILAEVNTHRMLSRNSASSRAIPVAKRIAAVREEPFVPEEFAANQKGMQAGDAFDVEKNALLRERWLRLSEHLANEAAWFAEQGVHKQWANRIPELVTWHTAIISATDWDNFFLQRCHPAASPEFQRIATMVRDAMAASTPTEMKSGEWHLPLVPDAMEVWGDIAEETGSEQGVVDALVKISVARCARVSYLTHDGKRDLNADLGLYEKLVTSEPKHLSPLEHAARVLPREIAFVAPFYGNFRAPWWQHRKDIAGEDGVKHG